MNFRKGRKPGRIPKLPLVALIDVVLFLLMYFMLATDMSAEEGRLAATLRADSGSSSGGGSSSLRPQIVSVETTSNGYRFRIGDRLAENRDALTAILTLLPKDGGVVVRVGPSCPIGVATAALQACKDAGFQKVSYVPAKE